MTAADESDAASAFETIEPSRQRAPLIFNSPHSGSRYPAALLDRSRLNPISIRQSEDIDVDQLFIGAVATGAPMLRAHFPRAWLDVNREAFELDPGMFDGPIPSFANTGSARVGSGLGTIPRLVADGKAIYDRRIPIKDALARIRTVYVPYHRTLKQLVDRTKTMFGLAVLIDCHSMPSTVRISNLRRRPDFVLGDRHGSSCDQSLTDVVESVLLRRGYDVSRNRPYAGGFITEHYGRPQHGTHALQIEVNRALYLNERTLQRTRGYAALQADLTALIGELARSCGNLMNAFSDAAE